MKQKTAIQSLISDLEDLRIFTIKEKMLLNKIKTLAKSKLQEERETIIDAYTSGGSYPFSNRLEAEEYYQENYGE